MLENGENNRKAIILFNLGGPDSTKSVRQFLYNLFSDKWIIRTPSLIRKLIAFFISTTRYKSAINNYLLMGGKSTLLEETQKQKTLLERYLSKIWNNDFRIFISMRYWNPRAEEVIKEVLEYNPSEIILLPLYPQFSSSTTLSSFEEFDNKIKKYNIKTIVKKICCYFDDEDFINAHTNSINEIIEKITNKDNIKILFSAHSIPKKYVEDGDPYEWQINKTYKEIISKKDISKYETVLCYQSKVGPIEWLSPSTEEEVEKAAKQGKTIIVVPIAFVSEHIETLVELDIEYKKIADDHMVEYYRVPTLSEDSLFINSLGKFIEYSGKNREEIVSFGKTKCDKKYSNCICRR